MVTLAEHLRELLARAACDQQVPVEAAPALDIVTEAMALVRRIAVFTAAHNPPAPCPCISCIAIALDARVAALGGGR